MQHMPLVQHHQRRLAFEMKGALSELLDLESEVPLLLFSAWQCTGFEGLRRCVLDWVAALGT